MTKAGITALRRLRRPLATGIAATTLLLPACDTERAPLDPKAAFYHSAGASQATFYGAAVPVGEGLARSYYTTEGGRSSSRGAGPRARPRSRRPAALAEPGRASG